MMQTLIFAPQASAEFGKRVAAAAGTALSPMEEREFEGGEHKTRPLVSVRGAHVYVVQLLLADVVRDVVEQPPAEPGQQAAKRLAAEVREDLPVGEGAVHRRTHGAEITLPEDGADRRTGELTVRQAQAMRGRSDRHVAQVVGAHLVAKPA